MTIVVILPEGQEQNISFIVGGQNMGFIDNKMAKLIDDFDNREMGDLICVRMETVKSKNGREFKNYKLFKQ